MISLNKINFYYECRKDNIVLDDFSYNFEFPKTHLISGDNGMGKSTLMYLTGGFLLPKSGEIKYSDIALEEIYIFFQDADNNLIFFNIGSMILSFNISAQEKKFIEEVLMISDRLEDSPFNLSTGEKRFLLFFLLLKSDYKVKVFDDPFLFLDVNRKKLGRELFLEEKEKSRSLIIISDSTKTLRDDDFHNVIDLKN